MKKLPLLLPLLLLLGCSDPAPPPAPAPTPAPPASAPAPKAAPDAIPPPPPAAPARDASDLVASGTLNVPEGAKLEGTVFVSVRDPNGGPPIAAKRLRPGPFPMAFTLTEGDKIPMMGNRPVPAKITLKAKLDMDSNALSTTEGDHEATLLIDRGTSDLVLDLQPVSP